MRLSTKSRFAVTAMIEIGLSENTGPVSLASISQRHNISISYLEQIFKNLRQYGLVDSTRGPGGGYTLNRASQHISVADIIQAVHNEEDAQGGNLQVVSKGHISTEELWSSLNQKLEDHMRGISLHSLISSEAAQNTRAQTSANSPKRGVFAQPNQPVFTSKVPNSVFALGKVLANSH